MIAALHSLYVRAYRLARRLQDSIAPDHFDVFSEEDYLS